MEAIIRGMVATALVGALPMGCIAVRPQQTAISTDEGYGPNPTLPPPKPSLIPTIKIAEAKGWPEGVTPKPAKGLRVKAFAKDFDHPRWLHILPNGDVLVAETNAPPKRDGVSVFANGLWDES
jgi:glucose/arabinose dehydrogenase